MPLTRYQIRNEYSLADPELYRAADRDDPEALLEGVAMAGLVGVLRQLGDLAEFAAEIFHDLHEEVMVTAARGHGLMVRVQQLEAEFPSIEKAFLSQTNHSLFFSNSGVDWHPNLHMEQNLITRGDLPRCVMDSYEECRGPPRLFLLDKFDVAGAGACLKRYTDPSFFKVDPAIEVQREKKIRKVKKKGSRWRNGETPEIIPTSHAKLHQLFLEESVEKGHSDPARLVKLKKRQLNAFPLDSTRGKSYMEKFLETSQEHNVVREIPVAPLALKQTSDNSSESGLEIHDISTVSPVKKSSQGKENIFSSPNSHEVAPKQPSMQKPDGGDIDRQIVKIPEPRDDGEIDEIPSILNKGVVEKEIVVDEEEKMEGSVDEENSDDMTSEVDNYMDALTTMESELETDNEYRPKTECLSNVEKQRMESDRNEEKLEFPAHFSDSQSVGNFSASDDGNNSVKKGRSSFSYSDTLSNVAEITLSDGEGSGKVLPSSEAFVADTPKVRSNQLFAYEGVLETKSHDLALPNEMSTDEDYIHGRIEASSSSCYMDSNPTLLPLYPAASSLQPKLDETPSECLKPGSESSYVEETETNLIDSSAVVSDVPSQTGDDSIFTLCSESCPVDNMDGGQSSVTSNALLHLYKNLELAPEKRSGDDSIDEVLQTGCADESCREKLISIQVDSPKSITSPRGEEVPCLALLQAEAYSEVTSLPDISNVVKPDDLPSEVDDSVLESEIYPEVSTSMVDTSRIFSFEELQVSCIQDNISQILDLTEKVAENSEESNLEDISEAADSDKVGVSTCKVDVVEGHDVPPELPSDCTDCSGLEDHDDLDDVATGSDQAENMVVSTAAPDDVPATNCADDNVDNVVCLPQDLICSSSSTTVDLPECPSSTEAPNQEGSEVNEPVSPECLSITETENGTKQLEVSPKDYESASSELVSDDNYKFKSYGVHDLSLANSTKNSMSGDDAIIAPASLALTDQELEPKCLHQNHVPGDEEETISLPTGNLSNLEICCEQSLELQADQLDVKLVKAGESSHSSNHQSELIQSSEHVDQEKVSNEASESSQEDLRSQASPFEHLVQSTSQEINSANQTMDLLSSFLPSFGLLNEANQVNLEEMPPLPPLPPMQWRLGKNHARPSSQRESMDYRQESFPLILPLRGDEKPQCGFSDQQSGIVQPGNPLLPLAATEVEKLHVSEQEVGKTVQPTPSSFQMQTMINDANYQQNGFNLEGTQSLNPFLTLSPSSEEKPEHGLLASEDEAVQSSSNPFLSVPAVEYMASKHEPVSSLGQIIHPRNQLAPETALEGKAPQHTSQNSEGDHKHPSDVSMLPPRKVEEQPQLNLPTSEGETAWPSNPFALPTSEVGKANGRSLAKLPRPRNPLIDAVAAIDKSKLRKVSERVRPQNGPNVDERDSLLEQIRTKSFNLKPAVVSRPSIHGPKTNLKVAAILEKANAIRQATAGSDEDDDEDSWSDS